jgi:putative oxidoreductase
MTVGSPMRRRRKEISMSTTTHDGFAGFAERERAHVLTATDWGLFFIRLALGVVFFAHGAQKVLGWFGGPGLSATVGGMAHMGIPAALGYIAAFTEFLGGLGLIFGVLARLSALGIFIEMIVAVLKVHLANGFFMSWMGNQKGEGYEYHLLVFAMTLMVMLAGPGRIALTDIEARIGRKTGQ